jgi:chaperonin GroES
MSSARTGRFGVGPPDNRLNALNFQGGKHLMKFRPLGDRVVVRRVKEDEKTPGGIIIPETAQEKPQEGKVIAVGPGALDDNGMRVPPEVKAGDTVLFGKWSGNEVKIDGEELLIMKESDIMGIVEGHKLSSKRAA